MFARSDLPGLGGGRSVVVVTKGRGGEDYQPDTSRRGDEIKDERESIQQREESTKLTN
jgi:hypothetical protein